MIFQIFLKHFNELWALVSLLLALGLDVGHAVFFRAPEDHLVRSLRLALACVLLDWANNQNTAASIQKQFHITLDEPGL